MNLSSTSANYYRSSTAPTMEGGFNNTLYSYGDVHVRDELSYQYIKALFVSPIKILHAGRTPISQYVFGDMEVDGVEMPLSTYMTNWNTQSRGILVSVGAVQHVEPNEVAIAQGPPPVNSSQNARLEGEGLTRAMSALTGLTGIQRRRLASKSLYMDMTGVLFSNPSLLTNTKADITPRDIRRLKNSGLTLGRPPAIIPESSDSEGSDDTVVERSRATHACQTDGRRTHMASGTADAYSRASTSMSETDSEIENISESELCPPPARAGPSYDAPPLTVPAHPALSTTAYNMPVRSFSVSVPAYQGGQGIKPPWSNWAKAALSALTNINDVVHKPLLPAPRNTFSSDASLLGELVLMAQQANTNYMYTHVALRALLYASGASTDSILCDKIFGHYLRGEDLTFCRTLDTRVVPADAKFVANITTCVVSLPSFIAHMKDKDPVLANSVFKVGDMDSLWCVVPVSCDILRENFLLEYIIAHLHSSVWAGRLNHLIRTRHIHTDGSKYNTYFTVMPPGHSVIVPGPYKIMIVLVDDNSYKSAPTVNIAGTNFRVHRTNDLDRHGAAVALQTHDLWANINNTFTSDGYIASAARMTHAANYIQRKLCTDMAFQLAVTMASEAAHVLPESPYIRTNDEGPVTYDGSLYGAWSFGIKDYGNAERHMHTEDVGAGTTQQQVARLTSLMAGYSWAAHSPMLQSAQSSVSVVLSDAVHEETYLGRLASWSTPEPTEVIDQYRVPGCTGVYAVCLATELIGKNDYSMSLDGVSGLGAFLLMHAHTLSHMLSVFLVRNGFTRKMWAGYDRLGEYTDPSPASNLVRNLTGGYLVPLNTNSLLQRAAVDQITINDVIETYYSCSPSDRRWLNSVPVSMFTYAAWCRRVNISCEHKLDTMFGIATSRYIGQHFSPTDAARTAIPWYNSTTDARHGVPTAAVIRPQGTCEYIFHSIDDWVRDSNGRKYPFFGDVGLSSNVTVLSLVYTYQDSELNNRLIITNDRLLNPKAVLRNWRTSEPQYPDPPFAPGFLGTSVSSEEAGNQHPNVTSVQTTRKKSVVPGNPVKLDSVPAGPAMHEGTLTSVPLSEQAMGRGSGGRNTSATTDEDGQNERRPE